MVDAGPRVLLVVLAVLLTALGGFLAAAEAAVSRVSRVRVAELVDEGRPASRSLSVVVADTAPYLSVATFLRVISESGAAVMITIVCAGWLHSWWSVLLVAGGVMTVLSFVLGGVSPRTVGRQHAVVVALVAAPLLVWLSRLLGPVAHLLVALGNAVTPGRGFRDGPFASESELRDLVDLAGENSLIEASEREMIHSVFELGDTVVREVMVPRTDMLVIERGKPLRSGLSLFLRSGFSRAPVVGEGPDDVLGVLYLKDVVRRLNADPSCSARGFGRAADAAGGLRAGQQAGRRPVARDAARPDPPGHRRRRVRRHGGPGHDRGHPRGDRRGDHRRVRP